MAHTPHSHSTLVFFSMCCEMILIFSLFSSRRLVAFFLLPTDRCWMVRTSPRMQPSSRAASRTPARVILSVEGEIARPCATDQQLVGVGQGVCVLNRKGAYDAGQGASRGRKPWMIGGAAAAHAACKGRLNCCRVYARINSELWKAKLESGRRARAKCTSNITSKFMTSDTSKLSGWLNAVASYRTARGAYRTARGAAGPRMCSVQGK